MRFELDSASLAPPRATPRFFGWHVVWAAFVLAVFGWGIGFYGPPIYLHAVMERTRWSLALVSAAVTAHYLAGALVVANLTAVYARLGVPVTTTAGAAALAIGVLGWSLAAEPWQLFAAAIVSGAGWAAMGAAAVNAIVARWFVRARPAALSMAYNGASIGGVIFSPVWVALIRHIEFGPAAAVVGALMILVVGSLSALVFSATPEGLGQSPDGDARGVPARRVTSARARPLPGAELWKDRAFLTLTAGMALGLFAQIGLLAHLFSLLVPALGAQGAGLAMGLSTACAVAGRSVVGWTMPVGADRRLFVCASHAVQVMGSILLIASGGERIPLLLLGVVLFGAGVGNATSMPPVIAQVEFVGGDVPRVVSLIVAVGQATYSFAPALFGALRGVNPAALGLPPGQGSVLLAGAALVQVAAIGCFMAGRERRRSGGRTAAGAC